MNRKIYAVLTGDIVKSSKLTVKKSFLAMDWLRDAANKFNHLYPRSIVGELDTFRHDSWQMLMREPTLSLRAAIYLRVALKLHSGNDDRYDSRVSIGIGTVENIAESRMSDSRGPAFTISGKNLDAMDRERLSCDISAENQVAFGVLKHSVVPLLDCIVTDWTATEAYAVHGRIERLTQEKIAETASPNSRTGKAVTRQAVADSLARCHWQVVKDALSSIEKDSKLWGLLI